MDFFIKLTFLLATTFFLVQTQKLPNTVRPVYYYLTMDTDLDNLKFSGTVKIDVVVDSSTNTINLHSKDLTIDNLSLIKENIAQEVTLSYNKTLDYLIINSPKILSTGSYQIEIKFKGNLGKENVGYYRAYYLDENKINKTMAVTHLESTNARRVFPCFDQPNLKAKFQINLIRKPSQVTSSNMEVVNTAEIPNSNNVMDIYETTLTMSTYLIAFMVSEYGSLSLVSNGIVFRTFARPELLMRGDTLYSLKIGPAAIKGLESGLMVSFPLKKMDQVPVPNDYYKIGAMENWGMVTYRERMLMYNSEFSTAQEKQKVATTIVHEFAHQWFGDLVTPEWWSYIWLNEGFATYYQNRITDSIEYTWDMDKQFITEILQPALNADSLENSRPMTRQVETVDEIAGIYDTIVYEKAASVLRMAQFSLYQESLYLYGVPEYLEENSYGNVNPTILYENFQKKVTGTNPIDVADILKTWETQPGYPVVTVTRTYGSITGTTRITLQQERFFINKQTGSIDQTTWKIPITYFNSKKYTASVSWLNAKSGSIMVDSSKFVDETWIIFNEFQNGFYRVNYDERNWKLIIDDFRNIYRTENRAQLIDDSFNLARAGRLNYTIPLKLGENIKDETHYVPIYTFNSVLSYLDRLSTGHSHHNNLKKYAINILEPIYNKFGFVINRNDEHLPKLLKVNVNGALCNYGFQKCLDQSESYFEKWIQNEMIQPDMQSYVYCYGLKKKSDKIQTVFEKYTNSSEYTERTRIATGLGCVGTTSGFNTLLDNLIHQNVLSQSDKLSAINSILNNNGEDGVKFMLESLDKNFTQINTNIGSVSTIISNLASRMTTKEQIDLFNLFESHNSASFPASLKEVVSAANETANKNLVWMNENKRDIILHIGGSSTMIFVSIYVLITSITIQIFM